MNSDKNNKNENSNSSTSRQKENKKQNENNSSDNEVKSEPEVIEKLSPKNKAKLFESVLSMSMERFSGSTLSPFESKITEKHIDKILEIKDNYDDKIFKDAQHSRKFQLIYILIGVLVFIFLTLFLVGKDVDLFKDIVKLLIAFVGGLGAGYGIKASKDK